MKIILDCDGILADFIGGALQEINRIMWPRGKAFGRAAVTKRDMVAALDLEEHRAEIEAIFQRPGFACGLRTISGAADGVRILQNAGHTVEIATAPMLGSETWAEERRMWLYGAFYIMSSEIHFVYADAKHLLPSDIFVDDDPDTVRRYQTANPNALAVLFAQPHNVIERADLVWVKDWSNLLQLIREHSRRVAA